MLTNRAAYYIVSQNMSNGKEFKAIAEKWNRTYPKATFTEQQAKEFVALVKKLRRGGVKPSWSVETALEQFEKPKLSVKKSVKAK